MKKEFKGRPVVPGAVSAPAVVSHGGLNTLATFQKSLLAKAKEEGVPKAEHCTGLVLEAVDFLEGVLKNGGTR